MTSLRFDSIEPTYIVMISDAIYLGVGRHLLMSSAERTTTIKACDRICKRIRSGNIVKVVVRKLRT